MNAVAFLCVFLGSVGATTVGDETCQLQTGGGLTSSYGALQQRGWQADGAARYVSKSTYIQLTFVGDMIFGRYNASGNYVQYHPTDGKWNPFKYVSQQLSADVVIGNLETPVRKDLPKHTAPTLRPKPSDSSDKRAQFFSSCKDCRFGATEDQASLLRLANFSAVSLANNHAHDQGAEGSIQTPLILNGLGTPSVGASVFDSPLFPVQTIEKLGWRIGLISATSVRNEPQVEGAPILPFVEVGNITKALTPVIRANAVNHDLMIALLHWGVQYTDKPTDEQRAVARELIDAGAHMVIGNHPHVVQGFEKYRHGVIAYSLGNFLWDHGGDRCEERLWPCDDPFRWNATGILRVAFSQAAAAQGEQRPALSKVIFHPCYLATTPHFHPAPALGALGKKVRNLTRYLVKLVDGEVATDSNGDLALRL